MTYLILLALGFSLLMVSIRLKDEVFVIAATLTGLALLVWGFALTPSSLQLVVESLLVVVAFPVCIRCIITRKVNALLGKASSTE
ncbi:hypothetical protein [Sphaerothrix gracilis]|uniref:hypothetical protein n=1 Tax=Sphaerothrix gracilis TaxID=3151835 RepID=UPI0031FD565D